MNYTREEINTPPQESNSSSDDQYENPEAHSESISSYNSDFEENESIKTQATPSECRSPSPIYISDTENENTNTPTPTIHQIPLSISEVYGILNEGAREVFANDNQLSMTQQRLAEWEYYQNQIIQTLMVSNPEELQSWEFKSALLQVHCNKLQANLEMYIQQVIENRKMLENSLNREDFARSIITFQHEIIEEKTAEIQTMRNSLNEVSKTGGAEKQ